ncbi:TerB family tellurite resistance protein [Shimia sp. R11_0]|uniref:tellurite resistance TerB family protein n=1 Tax=Shimia sp. R11_0 TaxID=2821096 RepID=UPI001ADBBEB6|nr:TerB family tellurite resistance protein [Shimia sp. R11_0]MBO9479233.1 TerB family tellurite resistance protein [Shimia sp. R11_0]
MIWDHLLARLRGTANTEPLPEPDEKLALGALLVRVAKSDNSYHALEIGEIDRILSETFGLNPIEAAKLRATCEKLESAAPGTPDFALLIRETVDYPHRLEVAHKLFQVIEADGKHLPVEDESLHEIEAMLGIKPEDSPAGPA